MRCRVSSGLAVVCLLAGSLGSSACSAGSGTGGASSSVSADGAGRKLVSASALVLPGSIPARPESIPSQDRPSTAATAVALAMTPGPRCLVHPAGSPNDPIRSGVVQAGKDGEVRFYPPPPAKNWGHDPLARVLSQRSRSGYARPCRPRRSLDVQGPKHKADLMPHALRNAPGPWRRTFPPSRQKTLPREAILCGRIRIQKPKLVREVGARRMDFADEVNTRPA